MQSFRTNDRITLKYIDTEFACEFNTTKPLLILIHGFTGSSLVWSRNIDALSKSYRVIAPDLRGHGESDKPQSGYHVSRLAMDLKELLLHLVEREQELADLPAKAIVGSLGCAVLWSYAELFTTKPFTHMVWVDQSPLQNSTLDGWDSCYCNRGMNSAPALARLQTTLSLAPEIAHKGTIAACLSYRSHPSISDNVSRETWEADESFFLALAMKGDHGWFGKLMADHTSLDWRDSIKSNYGPGSGSATKVLVLASTKSGCFPAEGPLKAVEFINGTGNDDGSGDGLATGLAVNFGGHWCYWENPNSFNELCLDFLGQ
ncbi:Alpha/Beta hydrolase protein [Calycina marina]|uniref:Alpha/Beta hydrolase protein n=1 Tax=Calycina marina TaxID=1763456 RepID=A0A9P7YUW2_9HELO|nr:Alpha/Beta hydrolase protein [Calycina marina]